jgi:hypothetical protein
MVFTQIKINYMQTIKHKFYQNPLPNWKCKTFVLGTFNPEVGSDADYYYGRIRPTGGWSNRFWPSVNSYLNINPPEVQLAGPHDLDSKVKIMTQFKFGCVDIISSVDCVNMTNITGNGFSDSAIFHPLNKVNYNTELIIDFINSNGIKKVISSFGKGTSLNQEAMNEIEKIKKSCCETDFQLFDLPAFGRPMKSTEILGNELFQFFL